MLNKNVFLKYKPNVNLTTRFDSDGKEIQVEIREDAEQIEKLQEIIDILVAAGYFRARIKGLSSFDKVIGGMTWCIESCNFDVDVDLLFHENLSIGQKISLTEKIVSVLLRMQCPHNIEPHQIQGLDFISSFPVIQWLVKKSVESREGKADSHRTFAISQFDKIFNLQSDFKYKNHLRLIEQKLKLLIDNRKRKYRFKGVRPENELSRVQLTLLEYDIKNNIYLKTQKTQSIERDDKNHEDLDRKQEIDVEELNDKTILQKLISCENDSENLLNLKNLDPKEISEHYSQLRAELDLNGDKNNTKKKLENIKISLSMHCKKLLEEKLILEKKIQENHEIFIEKREVRIQKEAYVTNLMSSLELDVDKKKALEQIQDLISKIESLREQESKFKESCKAEMTLLEKKISQLEFCSGDKTTVETIFLNEEINRETERLQTLRIKLAKRARAVLILHRKLDEIPGRAELAQYQRRFLELYNQVSAKHRETKQFYTLYNSLDDTKLYLSKELSLLNSIYDNYEQAMQSTHGRELFIKQFENIVEGIKSTKKKVEARYDDEKSKRDFLNRQLILFLDQQRKYVIELRNLIRECEKNEKLLAKFKSFQ